MVIDIIVKRQNIYWDLNIKRILFHNGSKFDLRLILKHLAEKCNNISCIAQSKETFYSLTINNFGGKNIRLKFVDSFRHLPFPLDRLVNYLSANYSHKDTSEETSNKLKQNFLSMYRYFGDGFLKLLRKGVFPYEYMNYKWEKKLKKKKLPDIKYFYSSLSNTKCLTDDYEYTQYIFDYFDFKKFKEYSDLYVMTNVLLLADVFADYKDDLIKLMVWIQFTAYLRRAMLIELC